MTAKQAEEKTVDPFAALAPGRIVHYYPLDYEARHIYPPDAVVSAGPWPAMVTKLENQAGVVTLNVNMPRQMPTGVDPVQRYVNVPYSEAPAPGHWSWPAR